MALSQSLQHKQSQSLAITPQLAQSIKLLQLSSVELQDFVADEIEKNPLLELDSPDRLDERRDREKAPGDTDQLAMQNADAGEQVSAEMKLDADERASNLDMAFENVYDSGTAGAEKTTSTASNGPEQNSPAGGNHAGINDFDHIAQLGETPDLAAFLESQIVHTFPDDSDRELARYIVHTLDEDGYFRDNVEETLANTHSTPEQLERVLELFHTLEPAGIGARCLPECLSIQLKEKNRFDPAMETMINNLELVAKREFEVLMKRCGVSREDFNDMIRELKALDPKPAAQYKPALAETVVPDITVTQKPDGNWSIELNPEALPRVLVNREYHAELSRSVNTKEGKEFIADCLGNANWLTKSLDQRAQTILKVTTEIVKKQDMFFAEGVEHMRPLNLKTIADAIKMHESTVSRATSNKYLMCDRGVFELKYFFTSAISSSESEEMHSAETVKHCIRQLVDNEKPREILSDDQIVCRLQETGIEIARRTVAKYRDAMRIPSSVQRRREKRQF